MHHDWICTNCWYIILLLFYPPCVFWFLILLCTSLVVLIHVGMLFWVVPMVYYSWKSFHLYLGTTISIPWEPMICAHLGPAISGGCLKDLDVRPLDHPIQRSMDKNFFSLINDHISNSPAHSDRCQPIRSSDIKGEGCRP